MRSIGADEARSQFYRLLAEAAAGEVVTITKWGTPVARLVAIDKTTPDVDDVRREMRAFRKDHRLDGISIRELIDHGRR
jgi:prevent-host-death family protein